MTLEDETEPYCFTGLELGKPYDVVNKNPAGYVVYNPYNPSQRSDVAVRQVFLDDARDVSFESTQGVPESVRPRARFDCALQYRGCDLQIDLPGRLCVVTEAKPWVYKVSVEVSPEHDDLVAYVESRRDLYYFFPGPSCNSIVFAVHMLPDWRDVSDGTVVTIPIRAKCFPDRGSNGFICGTGELTIVKQCGGSSAPAP